MDHSEYIRIVDGSDKAVLMIHGIAGTPAHFRQLIPVIPADWSVYNILLEGHGKGPADFGAASMKKWKAQVEAKLGELFLRHRKVVLVAHSMGALFSIRAAVTYPDRIAGLFLLAVPLRPWVRFSTVLTSMKVASGRVRPEDRAAVAMQNSSSIRHGGPLWNYIFWAPRFAELLAECRRVRKLLPMLRVPCQSFQSQVDELVSVRTCRDLEGHPYIQNTVLTGSGHFAYGEADMRLLQARLGELLGESETEEGEGI